jgi:DNA ligase-1
MIKRPMKGVQVTDFSTLRFPLMASPKIDGFRCVLSDQAYTSRLKSFPNLKVHNYFKGLLPKGVMLDGEIVVGKRRGEGVLRRTSSGVTSEEGKPDFTLWVFDAPRPGVTFINRLKLARGHVKDLDKKRVRYLKHVRLDNLEELQTYLDWCLSKGFEGIMLRHPDGPYKEGKSTLREHYLIKIKPFITQEARIIGYYEEMENTNEAKKDATGKSKRSSHKKGKKPKGTLGGLIGLDLVTGVEVRVGGGFSKGQRKEFWERLERGEMLGDIFTYKKQVAGEKDKPRHPVFVGIRPMIDMDIDTVNED